MEGQVNTHCRSPAILIVCRAGVLAGLLALAAGCQTAPLPPINLQEPGWTVRQGQAVWKRSRSAPDIAGDLVVATRADGGAFVQFSKTPFPLMVAQSAPNRWQVEIPTENKRYSGRGQPPARLIFLYLPRLLSGQPPPRGWTWQVLTNNRWRLANRSTGESLEGYLDAPRAGWRRGSAALPSAVGFVRIQPSREAVR